MSERDDAIEVIAEAWASIDGNLERFRANKADRSLDHTYGSYPGYVEDARALLERIEARRFRMQRVASRRSA